MAVGGLVKAKEWQQWWSYWQPQTYPRTGWERFALDATTLLHQTCVRDGRLVRRGGNSMSVNGDSTGYSDDELHDVVEVAERDLAWFKRNRETAERDAPEWAKFLFKAVEGALISRVRAAEEFRQVIRRGYLTINVNPEARSRDFMAGREDFRGVEEH